ncbi:DUF6807 family protein [Aquibium oceanicum]|uniref:Methane oxygenase PmoA n=1 Tax=Aquibium oceanicum TaxID=1670800 RepID=A0A1L3SMT0_9HYPH|nr:DUF6807 family protein [Aquibium oceanicum]APH70726.1 hypothetical protein BSQ44_04480 [Aquibium oceanicum]
MADREGVVTSYSLDAETIDLPKGAWARTHRRRLFAGGKPVLALTQGQHRAYVFPLYTPAGFAVTSERPADHPHHASMWIGADHVHAQMPAAGGTVEEYTYNFYVDEVFQGRAPGQIRETEVSGTRLEDGRFEIVQELEWRGPVEWGADAGRLVARERRSYAVEPGTVRHRIDVTSTLLAGEAPLRLGPTRHAYFNVRVADGMIAANGGLVRDDRGRQGGEALCGEGARWVDFTGPVGGGHNAGVTVIPHPLAGRRPFWFVADWGVVTVGPFRAVPLELDAQHAFSSRYTVLVHDGEPDLDEIESILEETD